MNNRFIVILLFLVLSNGIVAQQNNTLYFMHDIPQSGFLNPAVHDSCKLFIGLPVLSSFHFNIGNTALSYNDVVPKNSDNKRQVNPDNIISNMHNIDFIFVELHTSLLSVGYKYDADNYFTFNIIEKINLDAGIPKDILSMVWDGNTQFIDSYAKFDRLGVNFLHQREYSISWSKKIDDILRAGVRAKLIFGKSQVYNRKSKIRFYTNEDNYYLRLVSDLQINSSIPGLNIGNTVDDVSFDAGAISPLSYLLNRKNWGFAFDFGSIYQYDDNITYQASLNNIGYIRFKTDINKIEQTNDFEYTGPQGTNIDDYFGDIVDSIANTYLQNTGDKDSYIYLLSPELYLGATYLVHPKINLGIVSKTKFFQRRLIPSLTVSANTSPFKKVDFTLSYSYLNNNFNNIGMGVSFRGKHSQLYIVTDNFSSAIWPLYAQGINLRFGFNLLFGCGKPECPKNMGCQWIREASKKKMSMEYKKSKKYQKEKKKKNKRK